MRTVKIFFIFFLLLTFLAGGYFYIYQNIPFKENLDEMKTTRENANKNTKSDDNCPDFLIRYGVKILLYNSKKTQEIGKNPIEFASLDDYIKYLEEQKKNGVQSDCPVLFLQQETSTQGLDVLRLRPSPKNLMPGLQTVADLNERPQFVLPVIDATDDNKPYNENLYYGFDPYGLQVGKYTALDQIHDSTKVGKSTSDNPMDENWGGVLYTQQSVASGKYKDREIVPPAQSGPFAMKTDNINDEKVSRNIFA